MVCFTTIWGGILGAFGGSLLEKAALTVVIKVEKRHSNMQLLCNIAGAAALFCNGSLETFSDPANVAREVGLRLSPSAPRAHH
jgi:hypothetical protein